MGALELDTVQLAALAAALGWASGIRLYAVLFITGMVGMMGWFPLPKGLALLQHPAVLGASGFMLFIEFFADKIPGLDSLWDAVHTVIRIPAGAALAGAVFGIADNQALGMAAAILGGALAATSHLGKASTRAAINTSPEPFSNIGMSLAEDAMVAGGLWLAYEHPVVFLVCVVLFVIVSVWLIRVMWKFVGRIIKRLVGIFSGAEEKPASGFPAAPPGMPSAINLPPSAFPQRLDK